MLCDNYNKQSPIEVYDIGNTSRHGMMHDDVQYSQMFGEWDGSWLGAYLTTLW